MLQKHAENKHVQDEILCESSAVCCARSDLLLATTTTFTRTYGTCTCSSRLHTVHHRHERPDESEKREIERRDSKRDSLNTTAYYWLCRLACLLAALYLYAAIDAFPCLCTGSGRVRVGHFFVYFGVAVYIWKYKKEGELKIKRRCAYSILWIAVGFLFLLLDDNY